MANRHRAQRGGRQFAKGGRTLWNAKGSGTAGAIHAKHGFAVGGTADVGRAMGGAAKKRADGGRLGFARGGKSPLSSASFGGHGAYAGAPNAGGKSKRAAGGRTAKAAGGPVGEFAKGGAATAHRHGGKCDDDEDEDDEEEGRAQRQYGGKVKTPTYDIGSGAKLEDTEMDVGPASEPVEGTRARGGPIMHHEGFAAKRPKGMHARKHKAGGGHTDVYLTKGGTHYWHDDEHDEERHTESPPKSAHGGRAHRKDGGGNWISGAIKHPGALHKQLGVPQGEKIPAKQLSKAAHSDNPKLARRAKLAQTLKGMHH